MSVWLRMKKKLLVVTSTLDGTWYEKGGSMWHLWLEGTAVKNSIDAKFGYMHFMIIVEQEYRQIVCLSRQRGQIYVGINRQWISNHQKLRCSYIFKWLLRSTEKVNSVINDVLDFSCHLSNWTVDGRKKRASFLVDPNRPINYPFSYGAKFPKKPTKK